MRLADSALQQKEHQGQIRRQTHPMSSRELPPSDASSQFFPARDCTRSVDSGETDGVASEKIRQVCLLR